MKKITLILFCFFLYSCATTNPNKKNYLKRTTRKFIKKIPKDDFLLITYDTVQLVYDSTNNN